MKLLSLDAAADVTPSDEGIQAAPHVTSFNLTSRAAAELFSRNFVSEYLRKYGSLAENERPKVEIVHVGENLPSRLRWFMAHLGAAGIPIKDDTPVLLNSSRFEEATQRFSARTNAFRFAYGAQSTPDALLHSQTVPGQMSPTERVQFFGRYLMRVPGGMTFIRQEIASINEQSSAQEKRKNAVAANQQSVIGGTNLAIAFYVKHVVENMQGISGPPIHYVTGGAMLAGWIWFNMYKHLVIGAVSGSGVTHREVVVNGVSRWNQEQGVMMFRSSRFLISFVTTLLISLGIYWDHALSPVVLGVALSNAFMTLLSRTFIDQWVNQRQAMDVEEQSAATFAEAKGGSFRQRLARYWKGPHSNDTTRRTRFWWEIINAQFTNLHLINTAKQMVQISGWKAHVASAFASLAPLPFYGMTILGGISDFRRYGPELRRFFSNTLPQSLAQRDEALRVRQESMFSSLSETELRDLELAQVQELNKRMDWRCDTFLSVETLPSEVGVD